MSTRAPILVFVYNRLDTLKQTITALQLNNLSNESDLIIYSDAAKSAKDYSSVQEVRLYIKSITGFKSVIINEANTNRGLANSIISGVSSEIIKYGKVIVLEDDLVTSPNFLDFMNTSLEYYKDNESIFSISGFSMPINDLSCNDIYFTNRASSWGWASWVDRWYKVDWDVSDYQSFLKSPNLKRDFNRMGSDMSYMLKKQMNGNLNSWAIRWCYHQFKYNLYTVYPSYSKVINIGIENVDATHTSEKYNRFKTILDESNATNFNFPSTVKLDPYIIKQFIKPYSFLERLKYKILNLIF